MNRVLGSGSASADDDHHLVGVRHDDPFQRVGVVGGAAQHAGPLLDPDDPGEAARRPGHVAGQRDPVADDDRALAELARLHGGDQQRRPSAVVVAEYAAVAAPVDADHECLGRRLVRRAPPGARLGAAARADPDVVLVEVGRPLPQELIAPGRATAQRAVKSGKVLPTVATFSTSMPGTPRPSTAAGHHHPVVVVAVEGVPGGCGKRPGPDGQAVGLLGHVAAERVDLLGDRGQPVGLLRPRVADPGERGRPGGERRDRGERQAHLRDVAQVGVDAVDRARPGDGQAVRAARTPTRPSG